MARTPTKFSHEFYETWPDVLMVMHKWIREQISLSGGAARYEVQISLSLPDLLAARRSGFSMQPALDEFRQAVQRECGIVVLRPDEHQGLHENGQIGRAHV